MFCDVRQCVCVKEAVTVGRQIAAEEQNRGGSVVYSKRKKGLRSVEGG